MILIHKHTKQQLYEYGTNAYQRQMRGEISQASCAYMF